jgi:hypothetical protein
MPSQNKCYREKYHGVQDVHAATRFLYGSRLPEGGVAGAGRSALVVLVVDVAKH